MASLEEMLTTYNAKALQMDPPLKERKSFRDRKDATLALSKVGLTPEDVPTTNGNGNGSDNGAAKTPKPKKARAKKAAKPKKDVKHVISEEDDPVLAGFVTREGSKQYLVLKALIGGEKVSLTDLVKVTGTSSGSVKAILNGIVNKTKGKLLRGKGERPKYKLVRSKEEEGEVFYSLQRED
jgi:hypothetical protein